MTIRKIHVMDDDNLREAIDSLYAAASHRTAAQWALEIAHKTLQLADIAVNEFPEIRHGFAVNQAWQADKAQVYDVRLAGFALHSLARRQNDSLGTAVFRVLGQAVASGHMKEHAMVASDYAVKVVNLRFPDDVEKVRAMRCWQLQRLRELLD